MIVNTIRSQTKGGSIILEHDGGGPRGQTLAALPQYVRTLKSRGYKFVTVSELLGYKTTYKLAEQAGVQARRRQRKTISVFLLLAPDVRRDLRLGHNVEALVGSSCVASPITFGGLR